MIRSEHETLYHACPKSALASIARDGMKEGSYWTSNDEICDYYAETIIDEGEDPITLSISLSDLEEIAAAQGVDILPDEPGIAEPITTVLDMSEEAVIEAWEESDGTWQDSLEIIGSLYFEGSIPAEHLLVEHDGVTIRLDDYLSSQSLDA